MSTNVHLRKGADITDARHFNREVTQKVNIVLSAMSEREDENKGCDYGADDFIEKIHL